MSGRIFERENTAYRYGFNGKEIDKDITNSAEDYGMRIYDARVGKFLSVDPLFQSYPWYTPYQFAGNKPVWAIDLDGLEEKTANAAKYIKLPIIIPLSKSKVYQLSQQKYNHPTINVDKVKILTGGVNNEVTTKKYFSDAKALFNSFISQGSMSVDDNPTVTVSQTVTQTKSSLVNIAGFKYVKIESTSSITEVNIEGPATQDNIMSIKKRIVTSVSFTKVVSENPDGSVDLSLSPNDNSSSSTTTYKDIPLGKTYEENLAKLSPELAGVVDSENSSNKKMVEKGMKKINENHKKFEEKVNKGDYVPKK